MRSGSLQARLDALCDAGPLEFRDRAQDVHLELAHRRRGVDVPVRVQQSVTCEPTPTKLEQISSSGIAIFRGVFDRRNALKILGLERGVGFDSHPRHHIDPCGVFGNDERFVVSRVDTARELERLLETGVPFSITIGKSGRFVVKLGPYIRDASVTTEAVTMEEAVNWLRAHVELGIRADLASRS